MDFQLEKQITENSTLRKAISKHSESAVHLNDFMAQNPERSGKEYLACEHMVELLEAVGYTVETPFLNLPTAFMATLGNGEQPCAGILVEYDALPEIGHGCGHNTHGSMSILAALALAEIKEVLQGTIYVFGTPAEEENGAKVHMARSGVFDRLDLAIMIHSIDSKNSAPNLELMALKSYEYLFKGQTAHAAASPWSGINAAAAARKFLDIVDARRQELMGADRINGIIVDGGQLTNIIPDRSKVQIEIRSEKMQRVEQVLQKMIENAANGVALAFGCDVEHKQIVDDFTDMIRIPLLENAVKGMMHSLGLHVTEVAAAAGSSDMGNVSYRCPAIQPLLAITSKTIPLHTKEMAEATTQPEAHQAIQDGALIIGVLVLKLLHDTVFRKAVRESFEKQLLF